MRGAAVSETRASGETGAALKESGVAEPPLGEGAVDVAHDSGEHLAGFGVEGARGAEALVDASQELAEGFVCHERIIAR